VFMKCTENNRTQHLINSEFDRRVLSREACEVLAQTEVRCDV